MTLTSARVDSWIGTCLLSGREVPKLDPRVRFALKVLRDELGSGRKCSLQQLADGAGLSPSRFMHVFTESVGVPLRPYILWLCLQQACSELMNDATVAEAAYRSSFADAAHLTRTFRRMLGITPGRLVERRLATRAAFAGSS
jgi:AraC-like DNA-binding protein